MKRKRPKIKMSHKVQKSCVNISLETHLQFDIVIKLNYVPA